LACLAGAFALLFSWFCEWTPHGMARGSEVTPRESITRETGRKLDRWIIAVRSVRKSGNTLRTEPRHLALVRKLGLPE
jgi:hypothetical protein